MATNFISYLPFIILAGILVYRLYTYLNNGSATNKKEDEVITDFVYFNVKIGNESVGKIIMGLFGNTVPLTANNFKQICIGEKTLNGVKLKYENTKFHRIIPGFMIQGGDFEFGNGMGGSSIYGKKFDDENFRLNHVAPYYLSMANSGKNTNGSQFFITTVATPWLNGSHVVFGKVVEGQAIVKRIEECGQRSGQPRIECSIEECGIINMSQ